MSASLAQQLQSFKNEFVQPVDLIPQQLSHYPEHIIKAAQSGYLCGSSFRQTKMKESPFDHTTQEYRFWNLAFDFGMADSKKIYNR